MTTANVIVDRSQGVAPVQRRIFGSFVEHLGRCVYTGLYEPGHPTADEHGFRGDVLALVRELGVSTIRYPGGNFVSGYRWEDGVGPLAKRPRRLDLAWHSLETNEFGLDEFARWCRLAGCEPMLAVNLGTRGVAEALDLLEYANHPGGTALSEQRVANGTAEPHDIRMWCLGNEMDGPWQVGHSSAAEYGALAARTASAMKMVDPTLELVACGSSGSGMPTFGEWERVVLEATYDHVDYISCHAYYQEHDGDLGSFLASSLDMEYFIETVVATADHVRHKLRKERPIAISFDEWNVWYQSRFEDSGKITEGWPVAPALLEDVYSVADAVVVGSLLITLLKHSDRVRSASLAQLVNVIGPIMTEPGGPAWRQATFFPFATTARLATGVVLMPRVETGTYATGRHGAAPLVDAVVTHDAETGSAAVFLVNRSLETTVVRIDVADLGVGGVREALTLADADPYATNTREQPDRVGLQPVTAVLTDGVVSVELPPVSWTALALA
ncbi:MAG TPA: alpha-N-arabinofuranosidase [Propionicimonas sp.]|uniref:arabinosylfuranosidase ArfA n=1 Tax=Propionicimonas sp. TaxID=1955623 RepID=UPI002F3E5E24